MDVQRENGVFMEPLRKDYLEAQVLYSADSLRIGDAYVMHEWERPLIRHLVDGMGLNDRDDVLEIGFGMGISATMIQQVRPASHTIVEPHPQILTRAKGWQTGHSGVQLISGYWQQLQKIDKRFSAIFFDPFSDDIESVIEENLQFIVFAAQSLLIEGGRLALFCIHPWLDELYQKVIYEHYRRVEISPVTVSVRETDDPARESGGRMISVVLHK
jgi:protein arginine N-methyltransferase 2